MIEHLLKPGQALIVDEEDADLLQGIWYYRGKSGVARAIPNEKRKSKQQIITIHHQIMERILKRKLKPGEVILHRDKNKLNNQRKNLLLADHTKSTMRSKTYANNSSGYRGVNFDKRANLWRASIGYQNRKKYLGYYSNPEDAAKAYNKAAKELFGEFAPQNEI